jgi:hypothetical protein
MNSALIIFFTIVCFGLKSQTDSLVAWKMKADSNLVWDVDGLGNVYTIENNQIKKRDFTGNVLRVESLKTIGEISKIDASQGLKIAVFSENQQQLCFLDNNLSIQNTCIDFGQLGFDAVETVAMSNQSDRFWIFNSVNSELVLLSTNQAENQLVQNLNSILNSSYACSLNVVDNYLIISQNNVLYYFDQFGSFLGNQAPRSDSSISEAPRFDQKLVGFSDDTRVFSCRVSGGLRYVHTNKGFFCLK